MMLVAIRAKIEHNNKEENVNHGNTYVSDLPCDYC